MSMNKVIDFDEKEIEVSDAVYSCLLALYYQGKAEKIKKKLFYYNTKILVAAEFNHTQRFNVYSSLIEDSMYILSGYAHKIDIIKRYAEKKLEENEKQLKENKKKLRKLKKEKNNV